MKIALFGYGKMGRSIEAIAEERGHEITARVDSKNGRESFDLSETDVIIEFSRPEFAEENIRFAFSKGIPIVVGTTGWYGTLTGIEKDCQSQNGSLLYATNFSLGVNVFFALNEKLAEMMNGLEDYKASMLEIHHTEKLDAPSGTGISLAEQLIERSDRYIAWENEFPEEVSGTHILPLASKRESGVPGTHEVIYESPIDTIEIKHTAHNRKGFALGSVIAAEWLKDKKGIFTMRDVLKI